MTPEQLRARYNMLREESRATSPALNRPLRDEADVRAEKIRRGIEAVEEEVQQYSDCLPIICDAQGHIEDVMNMLNEALYSLASAERARGEE